MNKMRKRLTLSPISGSEKCYLKIRLDGDGDLFVELKGQTLEGEILSVNAQVPSPVHGGGDKELYETLSKIYDILDQQ